MESTRLRIRALSVLMTGILTASGIGAAVSSAVAAEPQQVGSQPAAGSEPDADLDTVGNSEAPPACDPSSVTPETTGTFNDPNGDGSEIRDHLADLVRSADDGSAIEMAMFQIRDDCVVDELIDAANERDVSVQVIGGYKTKDDDAYQRLAEGLNEENGDEDTGAKVCNADGGHEIGCIGAGPENEGGANPSKMHNKFALFSSVGGEQPVVFTSTANLSDTEGGTAGWNSAYTDVGNDGLYDRFKGYFEDLDELDGEDTEGLNYYAKNPPESTGNVRSYFHPRNENDDSIVNILDQVACAAPAESTINVANWHIGRDSVAEKLNEKAAEGCTVNVVVNQINYEACEILMEGAPAIGVSARGFTDGSGESGSEGSDAGEQVAHQKNMMIQETLPGSSRSMTFTGSHNFNNTSLAGNDENTVRIEDDEIHDQFVGNFWDTWYDSNQEIIDPTGDNGESCQAVAP